jgi:hypothetical protein
VTTLPELVFTDEQLTLLAIMAGEPAFPGAPAVQLDEAGWAAVAGSLLARGVLHAEDDDDEEVHDSDAVLGVALFAPRALWITMHFAPGEGTTRQEILWVSGEVAVRHTRTADGFHFFATGEEASVAAFRDGILDALDSTGAQPGEPRTLGEEELDDAIDVLDDEGVDAAVTRCPAAAGYLEALDDARCVMSIECSHRIGEDRVEGDGLTLVDSRRHGLWLVRDDPWAELAGGAAVTVQRICADVAREQVAALAALVA